MLMLKNLKKYTPEYADLMPAAIYFQSEDGKDWYYHVSRFSKETLKIGVDSQNIIRAFSQDASRLYPEGLTVIEIKRTDVPEGLNNRGEWLYCDGKITPLPLDYAALARRRQQQIISDALQRTTLWQMETITGVITEQDAALFKAWTMYMKQVKEMDFSVINDKTAFDAINWPQAPMGG